MKHLEIKPADYDGVIWLRGCDSDTIEARVVANVRTMKMVLLVVAEPMAFSGKLDRMLVDAAADLRQQLIELRDELNGMVMG